MNVAAQRSAAEAYTRRNFSRGSFAEVEVSPDPIEEEEVSGLLAVPLEDENGTVRDETSAKEGWGISHLAELIIKQSTGRLHWLGLSSVQKNAMRPVLAT
jgi:hypothetical protein